MGIYDNYIDRVTNYKNPEADAKLDALREQYWNDQISREEYEARTKAIIKNYVPEEEGSMKLKDFIRIEDGKEKKKKEKKKEKKKDSFKSRVNDAREMEEKEKNPPRSYIKE